MALGFVPDGTCGAEFGAFVRKQYDDYGRVIREANIKAERGRFADPHIKARLADPGGVAMPAPFAKFGAHNAFYAKRLTFDPLSMQDRRAGRSFSRPATTLTRAG